MNVYRTECVLELGPNNSEPSKQSKLVVYHALTFRQRCHFGQVTASKCLLVQVSIRPINLVPYSMCDGAAPYPPPPPIRGTRQPNMTCFSCHMGRRAVPSPSTPTFWSGGGRKSCTNPTPAGVTKILNMPGLASHMEWQAGQATLTPHSGWGGGVAPTPPPSYTSLFKNFTSR